MGNAGALPHPYLALGAWRWGWRAPYGLTPMQLRCLAASFEHDTRAAAAHSLGISEATLRGHLTAALARTGSATRVQVAMRLGWLVIPDILRREPQP